MKYFLLICVGVFAIIFYWYNADPRKLTFGTSTDTIFENENFRVDQIGSLPRLAVSYNINGNVYASEDHYVFKKNQERNFFEELGHFKKADPDITERAKDFIARLRITRDLRNNFGANNIVVLKSNTILVFYDKIYRSVDQGTSFQAVFDFKENGVYGPFNHGIAVDPNDDVYFGEYNSSSQPHKTHIFKGSKDGTVWSIFYEFSPEEILLIYSMKYDSFRGALWVCSGDWDQTGKLMYIDKRRKKVAVLGGGDQGWRIVSLIPTKNFLYWVSDNDRTGSNIFRYNFANNEREQLAFVGKPSLYSTRMKDGTLVFSTTYEPVSPYTKSFDPEPSTDLWISKNGKEWYKVLSIPGKIYATKFGPSKPTLILPGGDYSSDYLFLTLRNTINSDFSTIVLQITSKR